MSAWWVIVRRTPEGRLHVVSTWAYRSKAEAVERLGFVLVGIRKGVRPLYGVARLHLVAETDEETSDISTPRPNGQPVFDWSGVE